MMFGLSLLAYSAIIAYLCWFAYELNLRVKLAESEMKSCADSIKEVQAKLESLGQEPKSPPKAKKAPKNLKTKSSKA